MTHNPQPETNNTTRQKIITSACRLVLSKGKFFPSSEEIAVEASVQRTLIHYHFRSKAVVVDTVRDIAVGLWRRRLQLLLTRELSLKTRILAYIDLSLEISTEHPYLEIFLCIDEQCRKKIAELGEEFKSEVDNFYSDVEDGIKVKNIRSHTPGNIMIKLLLVAGFCGVEKLSVEGSKSFYAELHQNRKQTILDYIFY